MKACSLNLARLLMFLQMEGVELTIKNHLQMMFLLVVIFKGLKWGRVVIMKIQ
jgi:hypothetical protein